jgi:hypothetical protein
VGVDQDELCRLRRAEGDVEADVLLLVDEHVVLHGCADHVAEDLQRAVVLVEPDVEQRPAVVGPSNPAARVGDLIGQVVARAQIADADGAEFGATVVARVGEQRVVGTVLGAAEVPVALALASALPLSRTVSGPPSRGLRQSSGYWPPATKLE